MATRVAVLGDGAMGTACALLLAKKPHVSVRLWSAREAAGRDLQTQRENRRLLPGIPIPPEVTLTWDVDEAVTGVDLVVLAIPTAFLRSTLTRLAPALAHSRVPGVSVIKGLEIGTLMRPTEIVADVLGPRPLAVLSGPCHAEEMARGLPASLVAASAAPELAGQVQTLFSNERFRVYTGSDMVGVELAGALKNVVAIAAGISDGLGLGDNAKAALLTRALVEMARFGVAHGAEPATFYGLAGVGDLITTCISPHGRNLRVGRRIGQGEALAAILGGMAQVAEGVTSAKSVHARAVQLGIDMPISAEVYRVLYEGKPPWQAVHDLMVRDLKHETN